MIGEDSGLVDVGPVDTVLVGDSAQHCRVRDIDALLEQHPPHRQADALSHAHVLHVGCGSQGKGWKRGRRERLLPEPGEQIRGDLGPDVVDLLGDEVGVERRVVHDLQRPAAHPHDDIVTPLLLTHLGETPEPDVRERTADICEHLDHSHDSTLPRTGSPADTHPDARPPCPAQVTGLGAGEHWLVLNTYSVYPPMGGGQNRMFHLYRHLAAEPGRRVTLLVLAPVDSEERRREIAPGLVEHRVPLSEAQQQRLEALEKALGVPVEDIAAIEGWRLNTRFVELLNHYASQATMGVAAHPYLAGALHEHLDVPWGYESHNVEALLKRDILAQALGQNLPEAHAALRQVEEVERLACRAGAWVSACTEADLASFTSHYGLDPRRGIVVPNGADIQRLPFVDMALRRRWQSSLGQQRPTALFIGSWHGPNLEAARLIMERLAPACPAVDFLVVGSLCLHPDLADLDLPPNLRLMGTVTDAELGALLASADVALNPMGSGSGSNLKMLDYTASGVPVLTTPFGNRGFDFDERHLWLAELDRLAVALERLLATPRPAVEARVARARQLTQEAYAWHRIAPRLGEAARIHRLHSSEGGASMQACSRTLFSDV